MGIKKAKTKKSAPERVHGLPRNQWKLVVLDEGPIRTELLKQKAHLDRQLAKKQRELDEFRDRKMPAFQQWEAQVCGPEQTLLRALQSEIAEKAQLLVQVDEESKISCCSRPQAYLRVMERRQNPAAEEAFQKRKAEYEERERIHKEASKDEEDETPDRPGLFGESDLPPDFDVREYDRLPLDEKMEFAELFIRLSVMYGMVFDVDPPELEHVLEKERQRVYGCPSSQSESEEGAPARERILNPEVSEAELRLKSVYRQLARRLHPDANQDLSAKHQEIWHEVQAAYQNQDLEKLHLLLAQCENGDFESVENFSVGMLTRILRECKRASQKLQQEIDRLKKHPAWNFSDSMQNRAKLAQRLKNQIIRERSNLKVDLSELNRMIEQLKIKSAKILKKKQEPKPSSSKKPEATKTPHKKTKDEPIYSEQDLFPF